MNDMFPQTKAHIIDYFCRVDEGAWSKDKKDAFGLCMCICGCDTDAHVACGCRKPPNTLASTSLVSICLPAGFLWLGLPVHCSFCRNTFSAFLGPCQMPES
ncbi:unnamed protein product [Symbiodinium natans]|uniref:Uncharacterized protein n=1 Tax=Symbiodinium natans TaxID=878477 RepID=A0A812SZR6_9DINO|nr:unnamed protein product [Symbiodinium natans]